MQPLFKRGAVFLSSIPRRGGASRGGTRAIRGHEANPVPPPHTIETIHQAHLRAIYTDVNTEKS